MQINGYKRSKAEVEVAHHFSSFTTQTTVLPQKRMIYSVFTNMHENSTTLDVTGIYGQFELFLNVWCIRSGSLSVCMALILLKSSSVSSDQTY